MHLRQPRSLGAVCLGEILRQQGCRSPVQADIRADSPCARGHEETIRHFEELGRYLGVGITNLVNGFNPQSVIIGGPLSDARAWIEDTRDRS